MSQLSNAAKAAGVTEEQARALLDGLRFPSADVLSDISSALRGMPTNGPDRYACLAAAWEAGILAILAEHGPPRA